MASFGSAISTGVEKVAGVGKTTLTTLTAAGAGIAALTTASVKAYADYEQLVGGVETLFKTSADEVLGYAEKAYMTAGVSANKYMETVTAFSASLLSSLGGDTSAAAKVADMAIIDMGDNANKMGTSLESVQNAYQGFAKQNYTMLDNLKLGFGGTKTEMQRLLEEAGKLSGQKYDISNLNDVFEAIHVIQEELGITGTTALEATTTIQGSFGMMKASFEDLLVAMSDDTQDFDKALTNVIDSAGFVAQNLVPRIAIALDGISKLMSNLIPVLMQAAPQFAETAVSMISTFVDSIGSNLSSVQEGGSSIINMLFDGITSVIDNVVPIIEGLMGLVVEGITKYYQLLLETGIKVIAAIIEGIAQNVDTIVPTIIGAIQSVIDTITDNLPSVLAAGVEILMAVINGITDSLPEIVSSAITIVGQLAQGISGALPTLIPAAIDAVLTLATSLIDNIDVLIGAAIDLITGLANGLIAALPVLIAKAPEIVKKVVEALVNNLPLLVTAGIEITLAVIEGIIKNLPAILVATAQIIDTIIKTLAELPMKVLDVLLKNIPKVVEWGKRMTETVGVQILAFVAKAIEYASQLPNKMYDAIKSAIDKVSEWGKSLVEKGKLAISDMITAIVNTAAGLANKMLDIGKNIVAGVWQGIQNAAAGFISNITGFFSGVVDKVKGTLGIHSPSRVFAEIGGFTSEGFIDGFISNNDKAIEAVGKFVNVVIQGTTKQLDVSETKESGLFFKYGEKSSEGFLVGLQNMAEPIQKALGDVFDVSSVLSKVEARFEQFKDVATNMFSKLDIESESSIDDMIENLEHNQKALKKWSSNIQKLAKKGIDEGLLEELRSAGPESAGTVQELLNSSEDKLNKLSDLYGKGGESATSALVKSLGATSAKESGTALVASVASGMINAKDMNEAMATLVAGAKATGTTAIQTNDFLGLGKNVVDGISVGIQNAYPDAIKSIEDLAKKQQEEYKKANKIHSPSQVYQEFGQFIVEGLVNGISSLFSTPIQKMTELATAVINTLITVPNRIYETIKGAIERLSAWGGQMIETGKIKITELVTTIFNLASTVPQKIWDAISNAIERLATWGNQLITTGREKISSLVETIKTIASETPQKLYDAIKDAIDKVVEWGKLLVEKGKQAITDMINIIITTAKNMASEIAKIGTNIVDGVWKGIQDAKAAFTRNVKNFFKDIVDSVKSTLGIHSPSRVFAEIGKFTAEGFIQGIEGMAGDVESAVGNVFDLGATSDFTFGTSGSGAAAFGSEVSKNGGITIIQNIQSVDKTPYQNEQAAAAAFQQASWGWA